MLSRQGPSEICCFFSEWNTAKRLPNLRANQAIKCEEHHESTPTTHILVLLSHGERKNWVDLSNGVKIYSPCCIPQSLFFAGAQRCPRSVSILRFHAPQSRKLPLHYGDPQEQDFWWWHYNARSSATAKSTARPCFFVGVLIIWHFSRENLLMANQPLLRNWPRKLPNGLSTGTKIGDLEWPWTAWWPLFCFISTRFKSDEYGGHSRGCINFGVSFCNNSTVACVQWAFQGSQGSVERHYSGEVGNVYILLKQIYWGNGVLNFIRIALVLYYKTFRSLCSWTQCILRIPACRHVFCIETVNTNRSRRHGTALQQIDGWRKISIGADRRMAVKFTTVMAF